MKITAVIGMNYGDEGKGHITNFFSNDKTLNVKFNGGAQAAHGVFLSDNRSHIFHHFGSGSLRGAKTLLADKFIVNPILFAEELGTLGQKVYLQKTFIDPRCLVTTHYDMLINSFQSEFEHRNNTCGKGINETIERSQFRQLKINMHDLIDKTDDQLRKILKIIKYEYVPYRLKKLKLSSSAFNRYCVKRMVDKETINDRYLSVISFIRKHSIVWPADDLIDRFAAKGNGRNIIFEAGQGLRLSQHRKEFMPYLTRSNTGLKNVISTLQTVKTHVELHVYLVTRTYLTRHGDGPILNEFKLPHEKICDPTNPQNKFQGKMRYGHLDKTWFEEAISEIKNEPQAHQLNGFKHYVAMTCLDHMQNGFKDHPDVKLISNGPTEKDIKYAK